MAGVFSDVKSLHGAKFSPGVEAVAQTIIINSTDRVTGYPGAYDVVLNPRLNEVYAVSLRSFTGSITPFNVSSSVTFAIKFTYVGFTYFTNITFEPGEYTLQNLMDILNATQSILRFQQDPNTRRVIVSRVSNWQGLYVAEDIETGDSLTINTFTGTQYIATLLGFPQGISLPSTELAIQSVLPVVTLTTQSKSLMISLYDTSNAVVTTGNIAGCFNIPLTHNNYNSASKLMQYQEGNEYEQITRANNISLTRLTVRVMDSNTGTPFHFVGEHTMTLTFWQTRKK